MLFCSGARDCDAVWRTKEGTSNNAESLNSVSALLPEILHNLQNLLNDPDNVSMYVCDVCVCKCMCMCSTIQIPICK